MKFKHICFLTATLLLSSCGKKVVKWQGSWESTQYPSIMGTIDTALPNVLKPQDTFQTPVTISYSTNSLYRPNDSITVSFEFNIKPSGTSEGSGNNEDIVVSFKGKPHGEQTITFTASIKNKAESISGQYTSDMPRDKGIFKIQKL